MEIISPGREAQDRTFKRARYEALGVPAHWIVDPAEASLTELRLSSRGLYAEGAVSKGDETFTTDFPFPVELTVAALTWRG